MPSAEKNSTAFLVMDRNGMVVDWSPGAEAVFGWSRGQAIGARLSKLIIPERFRAAHDAGLSRFATTGQGGAFLGKTMEIVAIDREGREFPIEITISTESAPEGPRFRTVARRAEQAS